MSFPHKKIMTDDFDAKTDLYYNTLTHEEQRSFIKDMKTKFDDLYYTLIVQPGEDVLGTEEEGVKQSERSLLQKYNLFEKKNYFIHYMSKRICDAILSVSADTVIYGGFIRDNLLHDHMATIFYETYETFEDYNNPTIDKATMFRTIVPRDIDVVFQRRRDYDVFCLALKAMSFEVGIPSVSSPYGGDDDTNEKFKVNIYSNMELQKLRTNKRLQDMEFLHTFVSLDVTINGFYRHKTADFECNSLRMNCNGIISDLPVLFESVDNVLIQQKLKLESAIKIKDQISRMEAYCSINRHILIVPDLHRVSKMFEKGWRIMVNTQYKLGQIINKAEDCCALCRDDIVEIANVPGVHRLYNGLQFECCSAAYHPACLMNILKTTGQLSASVIPIRDNLIKYKCIQCSRESIDAILLSPMVKLLNFLHLAWNDEVEQEID
jgi:hypothetical protein